MQRRYITPWVILVILITPVDTPADEKGKAPEIARILLVKQLPDSHIYSVDTNGRILLTLTNRPSEENRSPTWSSDGRKIIFESNRTGIGRIFVMDVDGRNPYILSDPPEPVIDSMPRISPGGTKIVFVSNPNPFGGSRDIWVMDSDGRNRKNITNTSNSNEIFPDWSPDGRSLVFQSDRSGHWNLYVMDADGRNCRQLTNTRADDYYPSWSPDGKKIAFCSFRDGHGQIYMMNVDGSQQRNLSVNNFHEIGPVIWSPGGSQILLSSDMDHFWFDVFVVDLLKKTRTRLTNLDGSNHYASSWYDPDIPLSISMAKRFVTTWGWLRIPRLGFTQLGGT